MGRCWGPAIENDTAEQRRSVSQASATSSQALKWGPIGNLTADQIANYRWRAGELREKASRTADLSRRLEFGREARKLDQLAASLERVALRSIEH